MRLLDRYILRELLVPLAYCLCGFLIFWISFDLLSELSGFQEDNVAGIDIVSYYLLKTPELLVIVMPIALLLGLLYSLTNHARHNELTAMRAAGLSLERLSLPYIGVGLAFTVIVFVLNEFWVPQADENARELVRKKEPGKSLDDKQWCQNLHFRNARDGRFWSIGAFNTVTFEMRNPQVEWSVPPNGTHRLMARSALRSNGCWVFFDVQEVITSSDPTIDQPMPTNSVVICEFTETPEQIKSEIKMSRLGDYRTAKYIQFSISEILNYLRLHPDLPSRDRAVLYTKLHERFAAPWTCIVVVLIALPFGSISARRNVFAGVASSVFICFTFFVLLRLGLALGTGGYIPSWLGAWLPNGLFAAAGIWLTRRAL